MLRRVAVPLALVAVAAPGGAAATTTCASGDLRYPFVKGGPKTFGVFAL